MSNYEGLPDAIRQPRQFTAMEILSHDPTMQGSVLDEVIPPVGLSFAGFGGAAFNNWLQKRPLYAGIQRHILFGVAGFALGCAILKFRAYRKTEYAATLRHYVELHPEEFIIPERKTIGELFEPWAPFR